MIHCPGAVPRRRNPSRPGGRAGFSLLESLLAVTVLGIVVIAVISAISTSTKLAEEGRKAMLGSMAVDDFLLELITLPYDDLKLKNNTNQLVGEMTTLDGALYPDTYWAVGRTVSITESTISDGPINIRGLTVVVTAVDDLNVTLAQAETFVPEPTE